MSTYFSKKKSLLISRNDSFENYKTKGLGKALIIHCEHYCSWPEAK